MTESRTYFTAHSNINDSLLFASPMNESKKPNQFGSEAVSPQLKTAREVQEKMCNNMHTMVQSFKLCSKDLRLQLLHRKQQFESEIE